MWQKILYRQAGVQLSLSVRTEDLTRCLHTGGGCASVKSAIRMADLVTPTRAGDSVYFEVHF